MSEPIEEKMLPGDSSAGRAMTRAVAQAFPAHLPTGRGALLAVAAAACVLALGVAAGPAAAGLGALAVLAFAVAFVQPVFVGPLVVLLLPAGEAAYVLGAQVSPLDAAVGGGAMGYVARLAMRRESVRIRLVDWVFGIFLCFLALSMFGPVDDSDRLRQLLFWGALAVVFHAVTTHLDEPRDRTFLLVALVMSTLVEAGLAFFDYAHRWSERFSLLDGAIVYPLPEGTLGHPNALAQFLVLAVLAVLALTLGERGVLRRLGLLAAGTGSLALVVTFSRASWIAFAVGISAYLVDRRARLPVLAGGALVALASAVLALYDASAIGARISSLLSLRTGGLYDFRLELSERAARIAADYPLTGAGHFEEVGAYAGRPDLATHPHSLFLGLAVFFGIPAAVAFAGLVALALRATVRGIRARADVDRLTAVGFLGAIVALLVNGVLEYPLWSTSLSVLVVLTLAAAMTLERSSPDEP